MLYSSVLQIMKLNQEPVFFCKTNRKLNHHHIMQTAQPYCSTSLGQVGTSPKESLLRLQHILPVNHPTVLEH